ncbi:MAG: choice-of-anchor Q domain-containing protein [Verrucomicrobiales bacterium]
MAPALFGRPNPPFALTVQTEGSGAVTRNPSFNLYPEGSVVTLTANPATGWLFSHWSGDLTGNANPSNVEMTGPKSVTAYFVASPTYTLTVTTNGQGSVVLDPAGGSYLSNSVVNATATAANGWVFVGWSGNVTGVDGETSIRLDADKAITATFAEKPVIETAPVDVVASLGEDVAFTVSARGSGTLGYQWSFAGSPIANATQPTLSINDLESTDEGTYSVTVTNLYGSATASAVLQLNTGCSGTNVVSDATEAALRAAIEIGGNVRLCFNGTVTLTQPIDITKDVTLDARDRDVVISGNNATRLFQVMTNVTFAATNVSFANGKHVGTNGITPGTGEGGAILNDGGAVNLTECYLYNNTVVGGNGAMQGRDEILFIPGGIGRGGAILNLGGTLAIASTTFSNNVATGGRGGNLSIINGPGRGGHSFGGAVASIGGTLHLENSILVSNICTGYQSASLQSTDWATLSRGGAVSLDHAQAIIRGSEFNGNQAIGGAMEELTRDQGAGDGAGGAVYAYAGSLDVETTTFESNAAIGGSGNRLGRSGNGEGGAIYSETMLKSVNTRFIANKAISGGNSSSPSTARGGALYNASNAIFNGNLWALNIAQGGVSPAGEGGGNAEGGAILNASALSLTNSTLALNSAIGGEGIQPFGGPGGSGKGGGLFNLNSASMNAMNLTIASNTVAAGQGGNPPVFGANIANPGTGLVTLRNTILAYPGTNKNVHGTITDGGHNISSDDSANFSSGTSFNFTDPRLGPLADNGGPTHTMALAANSPAIDFGSSEGAPSVDQRGFPRPYGSAVDIGAYEFRPSEPPVTLAIAAQGDDSIRMEFTAAANKTYQIQSTDDDFQWSTVETIQPSASGGLVSKTYNATEAHQFFRVVEIP